MCTSSAQDVSIDNLTRSSTSNQVDLSFEFRRNYGKYFNDQNFSDLKLEVGCKTLHVSKLLLDNESPVFHEMLQNRSSQENCNTIRIEGVKSDVFEAVLKFLYTGVLASKISDTEIHEWLHVIDKYGFFMLKIEFANGLDDQLDIENAFDMLILADNIGFSKFKENAIDFIRSVWEKLTHIDILERYNLSFGLYQEIVRGLSSAAPKRKKRC